MSSVPSAANQTAIEFLKVSYRLATGYELLRNLNLEVHTGETLILLGRSGSGKTTTLKLINHLLAPSAGEVRVNGRSTRDWDVIRLRRTIGYAIQEVGLFPHFTVARNIGLVPQIEHWPAERIDAAGSRTHATGRPRSRNWQRATPANFPVDSANASAWPALWPPTLPFS